MENGYIQLIPREIREANWPRARFLNEAEQAQYGEAVKGFNLERARQSLNVSQNGSNLFKVILLNQIGIRTANIPQLYDIWEQDGDFLSGHYEDVASVALRSSGDSQSQNDLPAKKLAKSIKKRNIKHTYVLNGLELKEDKDSDYGLVLVPGDNFEYFEAPELDHTNNQRKFSKVDERGIPIFDDNGDKTLYTREGGLSWLFVNSFSDLLSYYRGLSYSGSYGRVVVVDAEGVVPKNLESYIANLETERVKQEAELKNRYATAMNLLKGNKR